MGDNDALYGLFGLLALPFCIACFVLLWLRQRQITADREKARLNQFVAQDQARQYLQPPPPSYAPVSSLAYAPPSPALPPPVRTTVVTSPQPIQVDTVITSPRYAGARAAPTLMTVTTTTLPAATPSGGYYGGVPLATVTTSTTPPPPPPVMASGYSYPTMPTSTVLQPVLEPVIHVTPPTPFSSPCHGPMYPPPTTNPYPVRL